MTRLAAGAIGLLLLLAMPGGALAGVDKFEPARGFKPRELARYRHVAVEPLVDAVDDRLKDGDKEAERRKVIAAAGQAFADHLVKRLLESGRFESVARAPAPGAALLIGGRITRYVPGNAVVRYSGLFGRSKFRARVELKDAASGKVLGGIDVDVASSMIPGAVNMIQSIGQFMEGTAIRTRDEILIARGDLEREETGRQGRAREKYSD